MKKNLKKLILGKILPLYSKMNHYGIEIHQTELLCCGLQDLSMRGAAIQEELTIFL